MSSLNLMELCRLCLVKERVSIAIFEEEGDIRQIFHKIATCLPVKVVKDDKLPKKICNDCLFKVENVYQFWNTTANAEKQLLQWLEEVKTDERAGTSTTIETEQLMLKEEAVDQDHSTDVGKSVSREDIAMEDEERRSEEEEEDEDEPEAAESEEEGDASNAEESDEDMGEVPGKEEVESDEEPYTELEPTTFVNVSLACDEAGPSGMQQQTQAQSEGQLVTTEAPSTSKAAPAASGSTGESAHIYLQTLGQTLMYPVLLLTPKLIPRHIQIQPNSNQKSENSASQEDLCGGNCKVCDKYCISAYTLKRHMSTHSEHRPFKCEHCEKSFKHSEGLGKHTKIHVGKKDYACDVCGYRAYTKYSVEEHTKRKHSDQRNFQCNICSKSFYNNYTLIQHLRIHSGIRPYQCETCGKGYTSKGGLNSHINTHKIDGAKFKYRSQKIRPTYQCEMCGKIISRKCSLEQHRRTHTGERVYKCDICGKGVTSSESLKIHRRIHTGEKPHVCDVCAKTFISLNYLKTHKRTHTGEKPYFCNLCGKSYTQRSSLMIHRRYHTGQRPYECEVCKECFITKTLMKTHAKTHKDADSTH